MAAPNSSSGRVVLIGRIAQAAEGPPTRTFQERLRELVGGQDTERRELVVLIDELVTSSVDLATVAPTISALLHSQLAADAVTATFLGEDGTVAPAEVDEQLTPDDVLRIARVRGQARAGVLDEPMLDAAGLAAALGSSATNPREFARSWRGRPGLLALRRGHRFVFPAFQFDRPRNRIWPIVAEINGLLDAQQEPWAVASFWFTHDSSLGARPADLVGDAHAATALQQAAMRELAPID